MGSGRGFLTMKIFMLGLPHTITSPEFSTCAFTQKVLHLCRMMHRAGHEVYHLGTEGAQVECTEHISVASHAEWSALYKRPGIGFYDTSEDAAHQPYLRKWAKRAKLAILERCDADYEAIVAMTFGGCAQRGAVDGVKQFQVESGIGYMNSWAEFRVYESYAWLHMHLGREGLFNNPKWYWNVIPNAFDVSLFDFYENRGDEFLYLGRLNDDKGIGIAIETTKRIGAKLKICGQGDLTRWIKEPHVSYQPPVGVEDRRKLLAECRAVFTPSHYVEPFCGVSIEAQLSGAPVICTDWGAFPENVLHGVTGYRCRTMDQFVFAARNIGAIKPQDCRDWAETNFSLENVAPMYTQYFQDVLNTRDAARDWNWDNPERAELGAMTRSFPTGREVSV